jgi:transposase
MVKYCVGIDISQKDFHVCISVIDQNQKVTVKSSRKFGNSKTGFAELDGWISKNHKDKSVPLVVIMEATGIYYEHVAMYLFKKGYSVSVVLPNKAKKYLQSTGLKSKNDKIDAQGLARMGAEQCLDLWEPLNEYFYVLREVTRQHQSVQEIKTSISNQLHAAKLGMYSNKLVIRQLTALITTLDKQIKELDAEIKKSIHEDQAVTEKVEGICRIKGVGINTVSVLVAETNGFTLFKNSRQLVSYAGYDVVENQSGKHKGKTSISKKGNSRIRRALYMPALSVVTHEQTPFINLFNRTLKRHGQKMKSYVAVQKKLLVIIYALWKNNTAYDPGHYQKHTGEEKKVPSSQFGLAQAGGENENSANPKAALHKVDILSNARSTPPLSKNKNKEKIIWN